MHHVIWQKTQTGCHEVLVTLPTHWQGETPCVVGPFSCRSVAEYFANTVVDFGQLKQVVQDIFAYGDAWYIEIQASDKLYKVSNFQDFSHSPAHAVVK